jgi:hypothetical protein
MLSKRADRIAGPHSLSAPNFLIVHHLCPSDYALPLELHGFPPWQIRLTEIQLVQMLFILHFR